MRFKHILYTVAYFGLPVASAIAAEEGFVFTEEDVAAAEEEANKLQSVIGNDETYHNACLAVYNDVNLIVGNCYRSIGRDIDYLECADARTIAAIHKEAMEKLVSKYGADASSGQLTKGALSRAALNMAKPNISPKTYSTMEKLIVHTSIMLRWFMGPFAKTCAIYDTEFYKEVQQVARFKELTQTSEYKRSENYYPVLWGFFADGKALMSFNEAHAKFKGNIAVNAYNFFERFHNELNQDERETLYNEMTLNAPNGQMSKYIRLEEDSCAWGMTSQGATMSNYEGIFYYWTKDKIKATKELGMVAYHAAMSTDGDALYNEYKNEALRTPDLLLGETYQDYIKRTQPRLVKMSEELWGLEDFLKAETRYFQNLERKSKYDLRQYADIIVKSIKPQVMDMREQAARVVPKSHPSRSRN
jgi:hypothetical protein